MADEKKINWANVKWPAAFVHPTEVTDSNGKTWEKAVCSIPKDTKINGVTLEEGYACSVFLTDLAKTDIAQGERFVHVGFRGDQKVDLFGTKRGSDEKLPKLSVDPFKLTHGIAENNKEFQARLDAKRAEKEAQEAEVAAEPVDLDDLEVEKQPSVAERLEAARAKTAAINESRGDGNNGARVEQALD